MRLRTVLRALLRRWYAVIAGLLGVAGLCAYLYGVVPADYKTSGSVVLLPSSEAVGPGGNPYLYLNGLGQAMDVLTRRLSAPDAVERLTQGHPMASYVAAADITSGSSILVVAVKSRSANESADLVQAILADVPSELASMQDELRVPAQSRISSVRVAPPPAPVIDSKTRIQAVAAAGVGSLLALVLLIAMLDSLLLRYARRRSARARIEPTGAGTGGTVPLSTDALVLVPVPAGEARIEEEMRGLEPNTAPRRRDRRAFGVQR
ncbi:hypothetical protein [Sinomonas sp. P10A9]|uniref:Capsular polysaccharide biosynthesis protein n=1 Tax=Sinomonas puerhi TaxID=3238584 RepID=A0AB39L659_9MICC